MTELAFLSVDPSSPAWQSPLARATASAPAGIRDVTAEAVGEDVSAIGPAAGVAGLELTGPDAAAVLRRLTDVDLERLPAVAPVARVRALVQRPATDRFRIWVPQEYAHHVAAAAIDAWSGVA